MDDLSLAALERARRVITAIEARGAVSGRRAKFFYFQFMDAFRLSCMARVLAEHGMRASVFTAEAIEVLLRRIVEQAILSSYLHTQSGDEPIDRFLKTSASQFLHSWREEHQVKDRELSVSQLPDYKAMSNTSPDLYGLYQKLSYLSHPRSAMPYSLVERENKNERGIDAREFYRRRCESALTELAKCMNLIITIFEKEDQEFQKKR